MWCLCASPEPAVRWRKDGRHIASTVHRYLYDNFHTELTINDVKPSDEATFTCHGTNQLDSAEHTIFVDVQGMYAVKSTYRTTRAGFSIRWPHYMTKLNYMCKLLTTNVHKSQHCICHWFLQTQTIKNDYSRRLGLELGPGSSCCYGQEIWLILQNVVGFSPYKRTLFRKERYDRNLIPVFMSAVLHCPITSAVRNVIARLITACSSPSSDRRIDRQLRGLTEPLGSPFVI